MAGPAVTRELKVEYGGFTVGGPTVDRQIHRKYRIINNYPLYIFEFDFVIEATTEADFAAEILLVEEAFRKPRGDLIITQGATVVRSFSQSGNTGFNARPQIIKVQDRKDGGRARVYTVRIELDLPADLAGQDGRQESTVEVIFSASRRRTVRVSGRYTALPGKSARDQYNDNIGDYLDSIQADLGGVYDLRADEVAKADDTNKILDFVVVMEEIIFNQSQGLLDDPDIVRQVLRIQPTREGPGDFPFVATVRRLIPTVAIWEASLDKDKTLDLRGKWVNGQREFVIRSALAAMGRSRGALIRDSPEFDFAENRIVATIEIKGDPGDAIVEAFVETERESISGVVIMPLHDENKLAKDVNRGPRREIWRYRETVKSIISDTRPRLPVGQPGGGGGGGGGIIQVGIFAGFPGGAQFGGGGDLFNLFGAIQIGGVAQRNLSRQQAAKGRLFPTRPDGYEPVTAKERRTTFREGQDPHTLDFEIINIEEVWERADLPTVKKKPPVT